ncbi:hypothetical protein BRYFOR_05401 [Marvinbryantia formatexigens DSM 14469]|uniref:Uncharacterized protein n=1 Tax=Marvinbryantia formatexigens DSM 14469 TaxID=478749 RepID=C6L9W0_9FIRM|nr:hypothetical protein BRYFOR_05401 [Marvinbryantia formatexigens DSM 14469]
MMQECKIPSRSDFKWIFAGNRAAWLNCYLPLQFRHAKKMERQTVQIYLPRAVFPFLQMCKAHIPL